MYTIVDVCPDCGSDNVMAIDRDFDGETQVQSTRHICNDCNYDWWEEEDDSRM